MQETAQRQFNSNPEVREFEKIESLRIANRELFEGSDISNNETCQWIATCLFFDWIERNHHRRTQSDADGNFLLTVPKSSRGVIMMRASRQLTGGSFENFYWMKEIGGDELDPIIFSSNGTLTGGALMQIVRQSSTPTRSSQDNIQEEMSLVDLTWFTEAQTIFETIAGGDERIESLELKIQDLEKSIEQIRYTSEP